MFGTQDDSRFVDRIHGIDKNGNTCYRPDLRFVALSLHTGDTEWLHDR